MSLPVRTFYFLVSMVIQVLRASGSPSCATCGLPPIARDAEERLMVEVAKQQLLDKLHLKERPNITQAVPRAALLTALRKLHSGRVRQDGTLELENNLASKDQGYEIVSFADMSKFDFHFHGSQKWRSCDLEILTGTALHFKHLNLFFGVYYEKSSLAFFFCKMF